MISCVRDIGVELADRALLAGDLERARWAARVRSCRAWR